MKQLSLKGVIRLGKYTDGTLRVLLFNPRNSIAASLNIRNTKLEADEFIVRSHVDGGQMIDFLETNNIAKRVDKPSIRTKFVSIPIMKLNPRNVWRFSKILKKKLNA